MPERLEWLAPTEPSPPTDKPQGQRLDWLAPSKEGKNAGDLDVASKASPAVAVGVDKAKVLASGGYDPDVDYGFSAAGVPPAPGLGDPGYQKKGFDPATALQPRPHTSFSEKATELKDFATDEWKELKKLPAQIELQRADNPEEAKASLERMYGKGNVGQDKGGRWWAKIDGKKQAIFGGGQGLRTATEKFGTGAIATAPQTAGSLGAEAAFGLELAPVTTGASIPAAWALGGAAGKGLDEALKSAEGTNKKTAGQEVDTLKNAALTNVVAFGAPSVIAKGLKGAANVIPKYMAKATESGKAMTNELLALGYKPPLASAAPGLKAGQYEIQLRNIISGDPKTATNVAGLKHEMMDVLKDSGLNENQAFDTLKKVTEKSEAISTSEVGEALTKVSKERAKELEASADVSLKNAQHVADQQVSLFKKYAETAGPIAKDTAQAISEGRRDMGRAYGAAYSHIDAMTGGAEIVPLYQVKNAINKAIQDIPPEKVPTIFRSILKMDQAEVSVMKMHEIRSALREAESASNLTPTPENYRFGEIADWADRSFKEAEKELKGTPNENAIPFMRQVDASYAKAIAPYKDAVINKLVFDMKTGLQPNPEVTARLIGQEGYTERTKQIIGLMQPETRRKVGAAYVKSLFDDAQKLNGSNEFLTSGRALLKTIDDPAKAGTIDAIYEPIYGKEFMTRLRSAVKELAAMDGKLDIRGLEARVKDMQPGSLLDALNQHLSDLKNVDAFVKGNPLASLASDNPIVVDRALRTIVKPGDDATLAFAAHALDSNSKEWKMIQDWATKDLLSKAIHRTTSGSDIITGKSLKAALGEYTSGQQKLLFPDHIMNKLTRLADHADFLFPFTEGDFGGSLAGAAIKGKVPFSQKADFLYLYHKFLGWALEHPKTLDYLVNGLDNPNLAERVRARTMAQTLFRTVAIEQDAGPGAGKPKQ